MVKGVALLLFFLDYPSLQKKFMKVNEGKKACLFFVCNVGLISIRFLMEEDGVVFMVTKLGFLIEENGVTFMVELHQKE
jgi:hypothetical protein